MSVDTPRTTMTVAVIMPMILTCKLRRSNIPFTPSNFQATTAHPRRQHDPHGQEAADVA